MLSRIWNYVSNNVLVAGLLVLLIGSGSAWAWVAPARDWLSTDTRIMRGALVVLALLLLIALAIILRLATTLRRERILMPAAAAPEIPQAPARFAPESFALTPARCRALLVLLRDIDTRTTLQELHDQATHIGMLVDRHTGKARVQHDMDDAERAGIVMVDRVGTLLQYYNLTVPEGRDWVLRKQLELQELAVKGMTKPIDDY